MESEKLHLINTIKELSEQHDELRLNSTDGIVDIEERIKS
jgi:hypothetical protein